MPGAEATVLQGICKVREKCWYLHLPHPLAPSPLTWRGGSGHSGLPSPQGGEGRGVGSATLHMPCTVLKL